MITTAQKVRLETSEGIHWEAIDDCLGKKNGDEVDNIEDLDTIVGWLAEPVLASWIRDLRDAVPGLYSQCVEAPVQRPLLHIQLHQRVLQQGRRGMGHEQRA